jgi:hypothetical protein
MIATERNYFDKVRKSALGLLIPYNYQAAPPLPQAGQPGKT